MFEDRPTYSFSRITTFEQCARRFRYRYLDAIKEGFKSIEAFMGQQVHSTIEWLFNERDRGHTPTLQDSVSHYCASWDREMAEADPAVRVIKQHDSVTAQHRQGAELVASSFERIFLGDRLHTEANEKHFEILLGGRHRFQGYIDRVARSADGLMHVIDYKTGRRRSKGFSGKDAEQLQSYALATFAETEEDEVELVIEYLRTKQRETRRIGRDQAEHIERALVARIDELESSSVFPPQPGVLCNWCGYNDICEASSRSSKEQPWRDYRTQTTQ